jgi:hypothetical protein
VIIMVLILVVAVKTRMMAMSKLKSE